MMILDAAIWEDIRSLMRNVAVTEETIGLDVVRAVGHGNTFLRHPHTVQNFKKELFFRDKTKMGWQCTLSGRMIPEARGIAKKILMDHTVRPLDKDVQRQGDAIIKAYEKGHGAR
jgi:trimethylamine--corrinoid protein Co-methyltransferase